MTITACVMFLIWTILWLVKRLWIIWSQWIYSCSGKCSWGWFSWHMSITTLCDLHPTLRTTPRTFWPVLTGVTIQCSVCTIPAWIWNGKNTVWVFLTVSVRSLISRISTGLFSCQKAMRCYHLARPRSWLWLTVSQEDLVDNWREALSVTTTMTTVILPVPTMTGHLWARCSSINIFCLEVLISYVCCWRDVLCTMQLKCLQTSLLILLWLWRQTIPFMACITRKNSLTLRHSASNRFIFVTKWFVLGPSSMSKYILKHNASSSSTKPSLLVFGDTHRKRFPQPKRFCQK